MKPTNLSGVPSPPRAGPNPTASGAAKIIARIVIP
jgi:hypothetical protein